MTMGSGVVSITFGAMLFAAVFVAAPPAAEASIVINELRRTVGAHAEYSAPSFSSDADSKFFESEDAGLWEAIAEAAVDPIAESFAAQFSNVYQPRAGGSLVAEGEMHVGDVANADAGFFAGHTGSATLHLSFTIDRVMHYSQFGMAGGATIGPWAGEAQPFVRLASAALGTPIAFVELGMDGTPDEMDITGYEFSGTLEPGTYLLDMDITIGQSGFADEYVSTGQFISTFFQFAVSPSPGAIGLLAVAAFVAVRRGRAL